MTSEDILAALMAQAERDGAEPITLRAIAEEAATAGAERALKRLGLQDIDATRDISDLRHLLTGWRDIQKTARQATVRWITTLILSLIVLGGVVFARDRDLLSIGN